MQSSAAAAAASISLLFFFSLCLPLLHFSSLLIFLSLYLLINQLFFFSVGSSVTVISPFHPPLTGASVTHSSLPRLSYLFFFLSVPFHSSCSFSCQSHPPPSIIHLSLSAAQFTIFLPLFFSFLSLSPFLFFHFTFLPHFFQFSYFFKLTKINGLLLNLHSL